MRRAHLLLLSIVSLASSGCLSLPEYVRNRPAFTSFDPAGRWYKIGRHLGSGSEYEIPVDITPAKDGWFLVQAPGHGPDGLGIVDGDRMYVVGHPTTRLYVLEQGKDGYQGMFGAPSRGPLGFQSSRSRRGYPGQMKYQPGAAIPVGIDRAFALTAEEVWGDGTRESWGGFDVFRSPGRAQGKDRVVLEYRRWGISLYGIGWMVGGKIVAAAATDQTSYQTKESGGPNTIVTTLFTTRHTNDITLRTFERKGDRMWVRVLSSSTAKQPVENQWIELWSRTPIQKSEFYAAACEFGSAPDCKALGGAIETAAKAGASVDPNDALAAYRRACDGGSMPGCYKLGLLKRKQGAPDGSTFIQRACLGGNAAACYWAAEDLATSDPRMASELRQKACTGGNLWACHAIAWSIKDRDASLADGYFKKACAPTLNATQAAQLCQRQAPAVHPEE